MGWRFNQTRIYLTKLETGADQIIARLQPLDTKTVHHVFGWESTKMSIAGLVATSGDKNALENLRKTGLAYTLSGPEGAVASCLVKGIKAARRPETWTCLFDRPGLPTTVATYDVTMELYVDE